MTGRGLPVGLLAVALATSCGAPSARDGPVTPQGWGSYTAGPLTIHLRHREEVEFLCRVVAHVERARHGCYLPATKTIVAPVDDAAALTHELKHFFEGAWHE